MNKANNTMQKIITKLSIIVMVLEMNKTDKIAFSEKRMDRIAYQQLILGINF